MGRSEWVSLTGGEPTEQTELKELLNTGLEYEEIVSLELLDFIDALKYGPYMSELRGGCGSMNQRMIMKKGIHLQKYHMLPAVTELKLSRYSLM